MQNKVFTHGDSFGITAERTPLRRPPNFVFTVVCCCPSVLTILFQPIVTGFAMAAAIDQTPHADNIAWFKFCNGISNRAHAANDLVTGHNGIMRSTPLIARRLNIRMADAAIQNINHYIFGARRPTFKHKRGKLVSRGMTGESICFHNQVSFFNQLALVLFSLARVHQTRLSDISRSYADTQRCADRSTHHFPKFFRSVGMVLTQIYHLMMFTCTYSSRNRLTYRPGTDDNNYVGHHPLR